MGFTLGGVKRVDLRSFENFVSLGTILSPVRHSRAGGNLKAIAKPTKVLRLPVELTMTNYER